MENLHKLLLNKNSSEPVFFGHKFKPYVEQVCWPSFNPCTILGSGILDPKILDPRILSPRILDLRIEDPKMKDPRI